MGDGEANTQLHFRSALTDATCVWFVRGEFKFEHFKQGVEQLEQLRSRGPLEITLGTPARLFSMTNALGDTFDGYLELVGPGSANPNGVPPMTYGVVPTAPPTRPPETVAPSAPLPTVDEMRHVGEQIATGDQAAFEKLLEISQSLYRGIDYQKERDRVITNLNLMSAAFEVLGQSIATGNQASLDTVKRSLTVPHLKAFAPRALGLAAAAGHEESLDLLLNFKESGILLSSAVSALGPAAAKNNDLAVHFLAGVIDDNSSKALWYLAAKGLRPAAATGNAEAKAAVEKYDSLKRP